MNTSLDQTLAIADLIENVSPYWIGGGWGVDALVGHQTRPHIDVDICFPAENEQGVVDALIEAGLSIEQDWRPVRLLMTHPDKYGVDLHPLHFDDNGDASQLGLNDEVYRYPAGELTAGQIGGRTVPCLSARLLLKFRTGYELSKKDDHDIALLRQIAGH